jgi:hypothetical protein
METGKSNTHSTNYKMKKKGKQILMGPRARGRYWRAESGNQKTLPEKKRIGERVWWHA